MRVLVQRVSGARVVVEGETTGAIGQGLLLLVGIRASDTETELDWMANKCAGLRIFSDGEGKMNRSVLDVGGGALVVSQFTLYGNAKKGNRPSFIEAAPPEQAKRMYERFAEILSEKINRPVETGRFAAQMKVELTNDGPVTIWLEREAES